MGLDLGSISASIGVNTAKLDQGLMTAELKLRNFDKSISSFGQKLTAQSTHLMVAGGLMAGSVIAVGVAAVKMASQFETSMRNVNSISKLSESEFKALGESVVGISKKFPQTAKELADGLYDIASSGFSGAAGLKVLEASAMAASAGMTNTATSAKGITAVLNAFSFDADQAGRVADTMFKTVDKGVITFEELSSNIGEVVGTANIAGVGFEELSGMIAYMTTKGISAAETMTALNRMMLAVVDPTEEMAAVLKDAGYESGQTAIAQLGLSGVMDLVAKAANGDVEAIKKISGDMRAFKAVASLTGSGIEELTKFMGGFGSAADTAGSAAIALAEQSKALSFQLNLLKNSATAIGIEIGNKLLPSITKYVTAADGMTAANTELIASNIILAGKIGGAVAGVLLLSAAYGKVLAIVGQLAGAGATVAGGAVAVAGGVGLFNMAQKLNELSTVISNTYRSSNDLLITLQTIAKLGLPTQLVDFFVDWTNKILGVKTATEETTVSFEDSSNSTSKLTDEMFQLKAGHAAVKQATEESTAANNEEVKSIDDMRGAYNELIAVLFDSINTSNAFQEADWALKDAQDAVTEAVKKYGIGSRETETAINGLDGASQTYIDTAYGVYTAVDATKEEQEAARLKAIEYGLQMVETGKWSEAAFMSMASQFGMSSDQIISYADSMGITLDEVTRARIVMISVDTGNSVQQVRDLQDLINDMHGTSVTIETIYKTSRMLSGNMAMGGVVGMASGGVVGIPQASSGMVVPQTGRAIPIIAHEYEDIVNTSQQRNLAEWIMGKANSRPDSKSTSGEVTIHIINNLDGKVLYENWEKYDLREGARRV